MDSVAELSSALSVFKVRFGCKFSFSRLSFISARVNYVQATHKVVAVTIYKAFDCQIQRMNRFNCVITISLMWLQFVETVNYLHISFIIMLATLLSAVQIFGNLNCLLMRSVYLDLSLSRSLFRLCLARLVPLPSLCCGALLRHVSVRCGTVRIGFVSDCVLPSCLWEPFHVNRRVCACAFACVCPN